MNARKKLFLYKNPYDIESTKDAFLAAVKENIEFHKEKCEEYNNILTTHQFNIDLLNSEADLYKIPPIPTVYLKRNNLFSIPPEKWAVKATSSGTKGVQSVIGFDKNSLMYGIGMMFRFFSYHNVLSLIPTNYIVLSYEPSDHADMGAIKTAYGTTKFAPAVHREYALKDTGTDYKINIDGIKKALLKYAHQPFPVRFVGFPPFMHFLVESLIENNINIQLPKGSKVILGGGWKQFSAEKIDSNQLYERIEKTLGIPRHHCLEFFSAVEHPLPYCKCKNGHFHVPIYSRVIIRDVETLEPVENGGIGLLSFVSALLNSVPLTSVITDDLAVLYDGEACGCGIKTPYFELKGRAGVAEIKTCTTNAAELIGGI